jgi:hypothetical protein
LNKREIKEFVEINSVNKDEAITKLCKQYYDQYYGNSNK